MKCTFHAGVDFSLFFIVYDSPKNVFCGQMVSGYGVLCIWLYLCLFRIFVRVLPWIVVECLLEVVLVLLGGVLASCMGKPVCNFRTLLYRFQHNIHHHSDCVEWQNILVVFFHLCDGCYGVS